MIDLHRDLMSYFGGLAMSEDSSAPIFPELSRRPVGGAGGLSATFVRLMNKAGICAPLGAAKGQDGRVFRRVIVPLAETRLCDATGLGKRSDRNSTRIGRPQLGCDQPRLHACLAGDDGECH